MPLHITFSGSPPVAGGYVGVGRTMIKAIKATVRKEGTSVMVLPDARIEARVVGLQDYLYIEAISDACSLYMESGYAQMGAYMHNRPGASDPAVVQLGNVGTSDHLFGTLDVGNTSSTLPDSVVTAAKFVPGEISPKAFFAAPRLNETVPSEDPYEFTDGSGQAGEFPISLMLERKKKIVAEVCPSLYSGKMRLFVQSLFGAPLSIFYEQDMEIYASTMQPMFLKKNGVVLEYSSGIFTADDGTYWLLGLSTVVTVRRVRLTACGKALSKWLVNNPQNSRVLQSEFEAFIFAGATIDKSFSFTLSDIPAINPMAYGWKFNWGGSQAACVSITGTTPEGGGAHDFHYISSRQTVSISRSSNYAFDENQQNLSELQRERLRWTITSTNEITTPAFTYPWGTVFVWRPIYGEYVHQRVSGLDPAQVARGVGSTIEIYGWFDAGDEFKAVTLEYGLPTYSETGVPGSYNGPLFKGLADSRRYSALSLQQHKFKSGDTILAEVILMSESGTTADITIEDVPDGPAIGTMWEAFGDGWLPFPFGNWVMIDQWTDESGSFEASFGSLDIHYNRQTSVFDDSKTGAMALVIPFFDSEAIYGFQKSSEFHDEEFTCNGAEIDQQTALGVVLGLRVVHVHEQYDNVPPYTDPNKYTVINNFLQNEDISAAPSTNSIVVTGSSSKHAEKCSVKKGLVPGVIADNTDDMFDASWQNEFMGLGNQCYTFTSAVENHVTGTNIEPSDPAFTGGGTFIGWF